MKIILKNLKRVVGALLVLIIFLVVLSNGFIVREVKAEIKSNESHGVINNDEDVKNFMNNYFEKNMKKYLVPGAAVVVVKDNKEVFKMGYVYSNLESKIEADPDKTSFPACSVSKLFTATAIMQLYEEGKIDLDKNINDYIRPYKVIDNYNEVVTCRNLLTHSSGLDEASELNGTTIDEKSIKSQEYFMDTHTPIVVTEPNTICRYSNEGYNLLGYIVEKVSGMGFGFIRSYRNGQEIIKHEGALTAGYTTTLFLIPKENLGIYVATNSLSPLPFNFEEEFINYFHPESNESFNATERNVSKDYSKYVKVECEYILNNCMLLRTKV